jgi:putative transposase
MIRKQHSAQFKAKVAVEAIRGLRPVNEMASRFGVHPVQVSQWKRQALDGVTEIFSSRRGQNGKNEAEVQAELYQQIGRLKMELEWLKKKCGVAE